MINLKEADNPYHDAIRDVLTIHHNRMKDVSKHGLDDDFDAEKALQSPTLLAVEIQIYGIMAQPMDAIFVVANDVVIFLFKSRKTVVVTPFSINDVRGLVLAENVPSACTIQVDEAVEEKIARSNLIFESRSMGLIMRYVLEREYDIEVDFCDSVPMRESGTERDFCFTELEELKQELKENDNNGVVRCTVNSPMHVFEEGSFLQSDSWKPIYGIMTNLGMFRYDKHKPLEILPKIMRLH